MKRDFLKGIVTGMIITGTAGGIFWGSSYLNASDNSIKIENTSKAASQAMTEEESTTSEKTKEETIQEDSFHISFSPDHSTLQLKTKDGETNTFHDITIGDMLPFHYSSPSGEKILLTPQNDFEEGSYFYVYTPDAGLEEIINTEDGAEHTSTPSGAVWLDERYILLIQTNRYGTVISGSLEVYDTESKELQPIDLFKGDAVTHISISSQADHPIVTLSGIKFTDDILNKNEPYVEFHKIDDILKLIQSM